MFNIFKKNDVVTRVSSVEALTMYSKKYTNEVRKSLKCIVKNMDSAIRLNDEAAAKKEAGVCTYLQTELLRDDSFRIINTEISCLNVAVKKFTGVDMGMSLFCETNDEVVWLFNNFIKRVEAMKNADSMLAEELAI